MQKPIIKSIDICIYCVHYEPALDKFRPLLLALWLFLDSSVIVFLILFLDAVESLQPISFLNESIASL